jgi:hypothetical protein
VTRPLAVVQDPRVRVAQRDLEAQYAFARDVGASMDAAYEAATNVRARDEALAKQLLAANVALGQLLGVATSADGAPTLVQRDVYRTRSQALRLLLQRAERTGR